MKSVSKKGVLGGVQGNTQTWGFVLKNAQYEQLAFFKTKSIHIKF